MALITGALDEPNATVLSSQAFTLNSMTVMIQNGSTGVRVDWKNNIPSSQTVRVWFVAYNSKNHIVFLSFAQLLFGVNGSNAVFQAFSSALPSDTYTVQVFVVTLTGAAISPAGISATVTF